MTGVGRMLREIRKQRGFTLRELAPRIGVHFAYLSRIETGTDQCSERTLIRIAEELSIDPDILLIEAGRRTRPFRVLGHIAAGHPLEALENVEAFDLSEAFSPHEHFMLRIRGDSMIGDGIHDGDLAIVRQGNEARSGQIVVAIVDGGEATLKRYSRSRGLVVLTPANRRMRAMQLTPQRVEIRGVLVGVVRLDVN